MFPLIPFLALIAIVGGLTTLSWYYQLSKEGQHRADEMALKWFGKQFRELAKHQQEQIRNKLND